MLNADGSTEFSLQNRGAPAGASSDPIVGPSPPHDEVSHQRHAAGPFSGDVATRRLRQVCHDARQELAVITALVERVISAHRLTADQKDDLLAVRRVAGELASTMRDVAIGDTAVERTDISTLLRTVAIQAAVIDGARIKVAVDDGLTLDCSASHARRVVLNLLDNARRAAGPDGWVELRGTNVAGQLVIEIEDSGPGFGTAPPGLASIGLSVVHDWLALTGGQLQIDDGVVGGARLQLWFSSPAYSGAASPTPYPQ